MCSDAHTTYTYVRSLTYEFMCLQWTQTSDISGTGVTDVYEPLNMGAGNNIWVLCKIVCVLTCETILPLSSLHLENIFKKETSNSILSDLSVRGAPLSIISRKFLS